MEQEKIKIASEIFDSPEKWNAFLELKAISDKLTMYWYSKLIDEIPISIKPPGDWQFKYYEDQKVFQWYLSEFGIGSLSIWLEKEHFSLKVSDDILFNIPQIKEEIKKPIYISVYEGLQNRNPIETNARDIIIRETGQFEFNDINDYHFHTIDHLAWFVGNKTHDYINQINRKLKPFFQEKSTGLISDLNILAHRQ